MILVAGLDHCKLDSELVDTSTNSGLEGSKLDLVESIDSVLKGRKLVPVLVDGSIIDSELNCNSVLVDGESGTFESALVESTDLGFDDCIIDFVFVNWSIDSVIDSVFDDRSIGTGLDGCKCDVLFDGTIGLVFDGIKLDSAGSIDFVLDTCKIDSVFVNGWKYSILDGSTFDSVFIDESTDSGLGCNKFDPVLVDRPIDAGLEDCKIESVIVDRLIDSVFNGAKLASVLVLANEWNGSVIDGSRFDSIIIDGSIDLVCDGCIIIFVLFDELIDSGLDGIKLASVLVPVDEWNNSILDGSRFDLVTDGNSILADK